jgi:DNA-binding transcriptional MocR family regulator
VIAQVLAGGSFRAHMESLRQRLARARRVTAERLQRLGIVPWLMPRAGFFLWCRLPDNLEASRVASYALKHDVVLAPGNVFSVSNTAADFMRFNVAHCGDARVMTVLHEAMNSERH